MPLDEQETARTQARYQRIAPFYDAMEILAERRYAAWRPRLWSLVQGPKVLEVGVGTGKNIPYYPAGMVVTAIDLTPGMLKRAKARAAELEELCAEALRELTVDQRLVAERVLLSGASTEDVARELERTPDAVRALLARARARLALRLEKLGAFDRPGEE